MLAFVSSGEGAKGAWQARAMSRLTLEYGIEPKLLLGSSSGAINSVGYSLLGPIELTNFWYDVEKMSDIFSFNPQFLWQSGLYTHKPLKKKLRLFGDKKFNQQVVFPIVQTISGGLVWSFCDEGLSFTPDIIEETLSAVTIPALIRDDYGFIDGGATVLCPLSHAINLGASELYIILGRNPHKLEPFYPSKWFSFAKYGYRFLDLLMHNLMMSDIERVVDINRQVIMNHLPDKREIKIALVYPRDPLPDALDFDKCRDMLLHKSPMQIEYL